MDDEEVLKAALSLGLINDQRLRECRQLIKGESASAPEALSRAGRLTRDQIRGVLVLARYDRTRRDDETLGEFIVRNGFLANEVVAACLAEQEGHHRQGDELPRLQDMLLQRNLLTGQQVQMILRARAQLEATRVQLMSTAGPPPPGAGPALAPPRAAEPPRAAAPKPAPTGPISEEAYRKHSKVAGQLGGPFALVLRKTRIRDLRTEIPIVIIDLAGELEAAAVPELEQFLDDLITDGATHLAVNCEKLAAIASDAIECLGAAAKRCRDAKGDLRLCNLPEKLKKVLDATAVAAPLRVYEGERGVVMSFKYQ